MSMLLNVNDAKEFPCKMTMVQNVNDTNILIDIDFSTT